MSVRASHANHRVFWRHLAGACHGESVDIPGGLLVRTGIPESAYNQLHLDADADHGRALEQALGYFAAHGLPWRVYAEQDSPAVDTFAARFGVRREPLYPVLNRPADPVGGWATGGLELSVASGLADLRAFVDCAGAAYRFNSALLKPLVHQRALDDPALRFHLGRLDGQVVAISVSVRHEDTVGIYFVGVRRQHRRHGFGRLLTGQALRAVPEASVAVLQATSAGLSLYQSMGFAVVAEYRLWDLPSGSG
jgi:GNAT superfamily N-acetyltransferase